MLKGHNILLRSLQASDLDFLQEIENNKENWHYGGDRKIFSRKELATYISNSSANINIAKQYRFVIDLHNNPIGFIDLFDYNTKDVSVGVIIAKNYRDKGFAKEALILISDYALITLGLKKIKASIQKDNLVSVKLFNSCGFTFASQKESLQYFVKLAAK